MADKKLQALDRLIGKLSAVRKTLRGEERRLLDQMVLSLTTEVTPHGQRAEKKNAESKASAKQMRSAAGAATSEVAVHGAAVKKHNADSKTMVKQMRQAASAAASEVDLHRMNVDSKNADAKTSIKQMRQAAEAKTASPIARIAINQRQGMYEVVVD